MRSGAFLVTLALLAPVALAQDAALRAAVAPAQTVVDAAARIVGRGLEEADRDGTPDEAVATLVQLRAFIHGIETEWALPEDATYRAEALAARDYARALAQEVERIPAAAARTSVTIYGCGTAPITREAREELALHVAELRSVAERLRAIASPPSGVVTTHLVSASAGIDGWIEGYRIEERCPDRTPEPLLVLRLSPRSTYPGGSFRVIGATNAASEVLVEAEGLGVQASVAPGSDGSFFLDVAVPRVTPVGDLTVRASAGNLTAERVLAVGRAPSQILAIGNTTRTLGVDAALTLRLVSPLRDRVANATLNVTGDLNATLLLRDGSGDLLVASPVAPGPIAIRVAYAGDDRVAPSALDLVLTFESPAPPPSAAGGPAVEPSPWPFVVAGLLVLAFAALVAVRRGSVRSKAGGGSGREAVVDGAPPSGATWIALFASLVEALRQAGRLPTSFTAREVAARLRAWGADPGDLVAGFERARYGGEREPEGVLERARGWLREAWARVRGATP